MDIKLTIICGRNLEIGDIHTSDPFVKFEHGGNTFKTKVKKFTLDPEWSESFDIKANVGDSITFNVYDWNLIGKADDLGKASWVVPELQQGEERYEILPIDVKGHIYISATCTGNGSPQTFSPFQEFNPILLQLNFVKAFGFFPAVQQKIQEATVSEKDYWCDFYSSNTATQQTRKISSKHTSNGELVANWDEMMLIEGFLLETVTIRLCTTHNNKDVVVASFIFTITDFLDGEEFLLKTNLNPCGTIHLNVKCHRGVYHHVSPNELPSPEQLVAGEGRYELTISGAKDVTYSTSSSTVFYCQFEIGKRVYQTHHLINTKTSFNFNSSFVIEDIQSKTIKFKVLKKKIALFTRDGSDVSEGRVVLPDDITFNSTIIQVPLDPYGYIVFEVKRIRSRTIALSSNLSNSQQSQVTQQPSNIQNLPPSLIPDVPADVNYPQQQSSSLYDTQPEQQIPYVTESEQQPEPVQPPIKKRPPPIPPKKTTETASSDAPTKTKRAPPLPPRSINVDVNSNETSSEPPPLPPPRRRRPSDS
ncbi:C2 domain-containing protein [Entamoeba marina]